MTLKYYHYKKCSTCVKAQKFLNANKIEHKSLNIIETPPSKKELKLMLQHYNSELNKLFNTSGVLYRELKIKDKINDMTQKEAFELLSTNGKLVKRPFLINSEVGLVGFKENQWKDTLI